MWHPHAIGVAYLAGLLVAGGAFGFRRDVAAFGAVRLYERTFDTSTLHTHCRVAIGADADRIIDNAFATGDIGAQYETSL
jgi:hypothetical protein